ncbi:MAG: NepR family anti-sigma factor [Hyphomicrobiales bacterium]|nr:NepR family anti-sigma factor [Hyphomicrobiales bacterium]
MTVPDKDRDTPGSVSEPDVPPELDSKVQIALGRALQAHYNDLISAPMPDRFLVLLAELEAREMRDNG